MRCHEPCVASGELVRALTARSSASAATAYVNATSPSITTTGRSMR